MTDFETVARSVFRPHGDAEAEPPHGLTASEWDDLIRRTPGSVHPWLARCSKQRVEGDGEAPSHEAQSLLDAAYRGATLSHLQRQVLLGRLLPALDAGGVPFVVLKGAALAYLSFPEPALRPMHDVDLWTRPEYVDRAARIALQTGLRYPQRLRLRTPSAMRWEEAPTRVLETPGLPMIVELHGALRSLDVLSPDWMNQAWNRREPRALGVLTACVLHPEDMITHLVMHCTRFPHGLEAGLGPLVDIGFWLRSESSRISWADLLACWRRERIDAWGLLTLSLARDFVGAPVPPDVLDAARDLPRFTDMTEIARRMMLGRGLTLPPAMAHLLASTPRSRAAWLTRRLTAWYWEGPPGSRRTVRQTLRDGTHRMASDIRDKLPLYLRGLITGSLRGAGLRQRIELVRDRQRLERLIATVETTSDRSATRDH